MRGPVGARIVEPIEKAAQIVGTRPVRVRDQIVDDLGEAMLRQLPQVLGKQAPNALQDEVAQNVGIGCTSVLQPLVQVDEVNNCLTREGRLATCKDSIPAGKK